MNTRRLGRLSTLAIGLGVGAAVASTPGIASADRTVEAIDPIAGIDLGGLSAASSGIDLDISYNGHDLFILGTGATATTSAGNFAIAFGAGSTATATGDGTTGDGAFAIGAGSTATAGGSYDYASAFNGASTTAGSFDTDKFNFSVASGDGSDAESFGAYNYASAANGAGAQAGSGSTDMYNYANASGLGSGAYAYDGSNNSAIANSFGNTNPEDGAFAIAGTNGSNDTATAIGQAVSATAGHGTDASSYDTAFALGNLTNPTTTVTDASATIGAHDTAFLFDPFGTVGSTAEAGGMLGYDNDFAGVFGDMLHAMANGGSNMFEFLPFFGM